MSDYSELETWIERFLDRYGVAGLAVAVTDRHEIKYIGTFGYADLSARTPVSEHHAFELGSIGKTFTALQLLRLSERGLVDLHAPVTEFLPWFEAGPHSAQITLHHLLTHTAGIIEGSDLALDGRFEVWSLRELPILGPPGEQFHYSNVGYKVLGYVIEEIMKDSYARVVTREVLAPLGMSESFMAITDRERARLAIGYTPAFRDRPGRKEHGLVPGQWIETESGDGSIASPIADFARFTRALLNRGAGLISDESFQLMIGDLGPRDPDDPDSTYGYGLKTSETDGRIIWEHGGDMIGYFTAMQIDPESGLGVCAMVNSLCSVRQIARQTLNVIRAEIAGGDPATFPDVVPLQVIEEADDLTGTYVSNSETWRFVAEDGRLYLERPYGRAVVERFWGTDFIVLDPSLDRDMLAFEYDEDENVVALHHGSRWLAREGSQHEPAPDVPDHWRGLVGTYQSYNPWLHRFRILIRRGTLWCDYGSGWESELTELEDGQFQVGESPSADRIRFDAIAQGQALRAVRNAEPYYRTQESSLPASRSSTS